MSFDGFITGWAIFGCISISESRPAGKVTSFDGGEPGGLDREAGSCMEIMDKRTDTGKVMSIENSWCLCCPCGGGGVIGDERELPQFGTVLFLPTVEKGGAIWSKDGNGRFGEDNFAVIVAELCPRDCVGRRA